MKKKLLNLKSFVATAFVAMLLISNVSMAGESALKWFKISEDGLSKESDNVVFYHFRMSPSDEAVYNCALVTVQDTVTLSWGENASIVRFKSTPDGTSEATGIEAGLMLEVRDEVNDPAYVPTDYEVVPAKDYFIWIVADLDATTYTVWVATDPNEDLTEIYTDATMRKQDFIDLHYAGLIYDDGTYDNDAPRNDANISGAELVHAELVSGEGVLPAGYGEVAVKTNTVETAVYPNPFANEVTISRSGSFQYEVFNLNGASVLKGSANNSVKVGESLSQGAYILNVTQNGTTEVSKLIKR